MMPKSGILGVSSVLVQSTLSQGRTSQGAA